MFFFVGLVEDFINPSLYPLKAPYQMEAQGLIVHNTWNDASAKDERKYMISNKKSTGFHIVVDDKEALQLIPFDRNAYHCGNGYGNNNYIGMEICYSKNGGDRFEKAEDNAIKVAANLLIENNWTTDDIKFHKDFADKNCPNMTVPEEFIREVDEEISSSGYRIINKPTATLSQIEQWANSKNASQLYLDLLPVIWDKSIEYNVDPVIVSVQCALETGYLKRGNSQSGGYNPAGIKSGKNSNRYAKYDSWEDGIEAQVKLLAKYAGVYGSESSWLYGKCTTVEGLTNLWAENPRYGDILLSMIKDVKSFESKEVIKDEVSNVKNESLLDKLKNQVKKNFNTGKDKVNQILKR